MKLKRKGGMLESTLGRVVIAVVLLIIIIGVLWTAKGKMGEVWGGLRRILRFG